MPRKGVVFRGTGKVCVMKKSDFIVIGCVIVCLLPFFVSDAVYSFYKTFNAEHGMIMSFFEVRNLVNTRGMYRVEDQCRGV